MSTIQRIKEWLNVQDEYTKTTIKYSNRDKLAKIFLILGILSIPLVLIISFISPRETIPSVVESVREVYPLLEPYQTIVYAVIWLFLTFIILAFAFMMKSEKTIKPKKD